MSGSGGSWPDLWTVRLSLSSPCLPKREHHQALQLLTTTLRLTCY